MSRFEREPDAIHSSVPQGANVIVVIVVVVVVVIVFVVLYNRAGLVLLATK